jgi:hypothetical protein
VHKDYFRDVLTPEGAKWWVWGQGACELATREMGMQKWKSKKLIALTFSKISQVYYPWCSFPEWKNVELSGAANQPLWLSARIKRSRFSLKLGCYCPTTPH